MNFWPVRPMDIAKIYKLIDLNAIGKRLLTTTIVRKSKLKMNTHTPEMLRLSGQICTFFDHRRKSFTSLCCYVSVKKILATCNLIRFRYWVKNFVTFPLSTAMMAINIRILWRKNSDQTFFNGKQEMQWENKICVYKLNRSRFSVCAKYGESMIFLVDFIAKIIPFRMLVYVCVFFFLFSRS